jgi:hypothetical protein
MQNRAKAEGRFDRGLLVCLLIALVPRVRPALVGLVPERERLQFSLFLDCWSPFSMWVGAGLASAQLTFLAWLRTAGRATNRQRFLRDNLHPNTLRRLAPKVWSIVTSTQSLFVEY